MIGCMQIQGMQRAMGIPALPSDSPQAHLQQQQALHLHCSYQLEELRLCRLLALRLGPACQNAVHLFAGDTCVLTSDPLMDEQDCSAATRMHNLLTFMVISSM